MKSKPPLYLKLIPPVILSVMVVGVYMAGNFMGELLSSDPQEKMLVFLEKEGETARTIERFFVELNKLSKPAVRKKQRRPAPAHEGRDLLAEPASVRLSANPRQIFDFGSNPESAVLDIDTSAGVLATFKAGVTGAVPNAEIKIMDMGKEKNSYVSCSVIFKKEILLKGMQALVVKARAEGIKAFGVSAQARKGDSILRWDKPRAEVTEQWQTMILPFNDFNYWNYNMKSRSYTLMKRWRAPEKTGQIVFYFKPADLDDGNTGKFFIKSIALR